jgi:transcriptional regulator with XRE-family HTH domain
MIKVYNVEEIEHKIGDTIMNLRKTRGYTRLELGQLLNVSHQQIAKYESGTNRITAGKLYLLAQIMNVSLDYFFTDISTPMQQLATRNISDREQIDIAKYFMSIANPRKRDAVKLLARLFSEDNAVMH